jgi:hypothetical protein
LLLLRWMLQSQQVLSGVRSLSVSFGCIPGLDKDMFAWNGLSPHETSWLEDAWVLLPGHSPLSMSHSSSHCHDQIVGPPSYKCVVWYSLSTRKPV